LKLHVEAVVSRVGWLLLDYLNRSSRLRLGRLEVASNTHLGELEQVLMDEL